MAGTPMGTTADAVEAVGGIEEEWFFEGTATAYGLADGIDQYPTDGRWPAVTIDEAPFRTRMVVVRPRDPATFNGTVLVLWNNVSAGESFVQGNRAAQMLEDGFAVVGVSAQRVGVEGPSAELAALGMVAPSLKGDDPERYGDLQHPGDDFSYDIYTQAARLVASDRPRDDDPLDGLEVRHLLAYGGSQSAARLAAYLNGVQPITSQFDAFLLLVFPNAPCALNAASAPAEIREAGGTNMHDLLVWHEHVLRDDLGIPVIVVNSEWESAECFPNHQDETDFVRWWEVPGSGHIGSATPDEMEMVAAMGFQGSTVSFAPALRAAFHALQQWLDGGAPPPRQPRFERQDGTRVLARDEHGNALGGIRWPDVEAPLATHVGENLTDNIANVGGSSTPFPPEKVRALYPDHSAWYRKYEAAVEQLVAAQVVLPDDAAAMLARAAELELPA